MQAMHRTASAQGLTSEQLDRYWSDGIVRPITALDEEAALSLIPKFERLKNRMAGWTNAKQVLKSYLVVPWVSRLVRHPSILDAVESVLGPDIMLWGGTFFAKPPDNSLHVGWHQDLTYWGLEPADSVLTVWLAISNADEENGAMQVIRGSHRAGIRSHSLTGDASNMLMSRQNVSLSQTDLDHVEVVELLPGQFSMHHSLALHGSGANRSNGPRVGLSLNYIATGAVQRKNGGHDSAMLVRGIDRHRHFEHEQEPSAEFAPQSLEQYKRAIAMPSGLGTADDGTVDMVLYENIH